MQPSEAEQFYVAHLIGSVGVVHSIGDMLTEKLGGLWRQKARDIIEFASLQPPMRTVTCGPYELQHRWTMRMVAICDPTSDITRCIIYDYNLEPELVLERAATPGEKTRFIVVYRASEKWPEPGSLMQSA